MKTYLKPLLLLLAVLLTFGLVACDDSSDDPTPTSGKGDLRSVSGQLKVDGSTDAVAKAKVMALAGDKKLSAQVNAGAKGFVIDGLDDLPDGTAITILIDLGDGPIPVKFPKDEDALDQLASLIPDVDILQTLVGDEDFFDMDLGDLVLSADGTYFSPEFNPFDFFDTDLDGIADWEDDDLDGDGVDNWDDEDPWGEDWEDWGWDDETWGDWDEDGDGEADWEDDDWGGDDYWDMGDIDEWDVCEEDDDTCWDDMCATDPDLCMEDDEYCIIFPEDPFCEEAIDCDLNPTHPYCAGVDCPDPNNPACAIDCIENPAHPDCTACEDGNCVDCDADPTNPLCDPIDDPCLEDPTLPECDIDDPCLDDPSLPECSVDCDADPTNPACLTDCETDPTLPECSDICFDIDTTECADYCWDNAGDPICEEYCIENPMECAGI